ncbi:MAG: bile acid:sodium symporter family protein [Sulfurovum sp.]|nr:bile acid:sodium symporter family protein [Sulfurovum sp.]
MFGLGLSLRIADFTYIFKQPKAVLVGLSAQIIALPLIALLIAILFKLPPELAVGLMIISFAPSGSTSNMFTHLAKGDVALSISLTAITSLITPFTIPLFVLLAMKYFLGSESVVEISFLKTFIQLLVMIILPVILGMFIVSKWQKKVDKAEPLIRIFSIVFLFLIVVAIIVKNKAEMIGFFMQSGAAVLTLNIAVLGLGYWLARFFQLSQKQAISIGYEVGIQNAPLALIIAGTIIANGTMMIPAVTYGLLMLITGFAFYWIMKKNSE